MLVRSKKNRAASSVGEEVEIVAPGELVRSTGVLGEKIVSSGTSLAAPQVAGVAALIWRRVRICRRISCESS